MEPWTDGAPLIFKSKLPLIRELRGFMDCGAPLILESELPIARDLRGWSLGLHQNFLSPVNSEDRTLD